MAGSGSGEKPREMEGDIGSGGPQGFVDFRGGRLSARRGHTGLPLQSFIPACSRSMPARRTWKLVERFLSFDKNLAILRAPETF